LVGDILKKRREELGRDLRDISDILKIKCDYLRSIEDEAFDKLPEPVYVRGYIREYAEFLNIDTETVLNAYTQQVLAPVTENKTAAEGEAPQVKKTRTRRYAIPFLLVLFALITLFLFSPLSPLQHDTSSPPSKKDEISRSVAESAPETPLSEAETITPSMNSVLEESPQPPAGPQKDLLPVMDTPHVLEITADDITWLAITIDEAAPREVTMNPGETLKVNANKNIHLKIGNAGGVKLVFDGKEIGKLGQKGEVITMNLPEDRSFP
jgi:cytoskeletal protein RodZ